MSLTPEQQTCVKIDELLVQAGWIIQDKSEFNRNAGLGVAVREFQLTSGFCDYLLFLDGKAAAILEAKKEGTTLPPIEKQHEIVDIIEKIFSAINKTEAELKKQFSAITSLRQSILKSAFSGKLVAQDPNDEPASELLKRIAAEKEKIAIEQKNKMPKRKAKMKVVEKIMRTSEKEVVNG